MRVQRRQVRRPLVQAVVHPTRGRALSAMSHSGHPKTQPCRRGSRSRTAGAVFEMPRRPIEGKSVIYCCLLCSVLLCLAHISSPVLFASLSLCHSVSLSFPVPVPGRRPVMTRIPQNPGMCVRFNSWTLLVFLGKPPHLLLNKLAPRPGLGLKHSKISCVSAVTTSGTRGNQCKLCDSLGKD
ncbi:hypothetical protein F5Y10DRAFT_149069 [Nemania abortiva]|nr:hypothetical protein F5Y10DRAFT_149069 [Nemania abortiva]